MDKTSFSVRVFFQRFGLVIAFVILCVALTALSDQFLTLSNARNILRQSSINGIISVGMTMVILTAGIDLSVGSVLALTGVVVADLVQSFQNPLPLAVVQVAVLPGDGVLCTYLEGANFRRYIMPRQFKRLSHSIYECKYHIVFCPKYRYRILRDEVAEYTRQQIYRLCPQKEDVEVLELKVQPDHVHLVVSIPPKYAVLSFMGYLKGKLATRLFARYERLGRRYWGRHLWSRGYCVSTIGLDEDKIRKYVKWREQREKHLEATQDRLFD